MNLEPILDYIASRGLGVKGVDLFAHSMPAKVKNGVMVMINSPATIHPYQKCKRNGTLQVMVRGVTYGDIGNKAEAISSLLDAEGLVLGGLKLLIIYPLHEPMIYPRSEGSLLEASVNFNFTYVI
jgi:hypothetical protein